MIPKPTHRLDLLIVVHQGKQFLKAIKVAQNNQMVWDCESILLDMYANQKHYRYEIKSFKHLLDANQDT